MLSRNANVLWLRKCREAHVSHMILHMLHQTTILSSSFLKIGNHTSWIHGNAHPMLCHFQIASIWLSSHSLWCETVCWGTDEDICRLCIFHLEHVHDFMNYMRRKLQGYILSQTTRSLKVLKLKGTNFGLWKNQIYNILAWRQWWRSIDWKRHPTMEDKY